MRLLIVDGDPGERERVAVALRQGIEEVEPVAVADVGELERQLGGPPPGAVITEDRLPWASGFQVLGAVRRRWPGVPVVMLTSSGNEELAVAAVKAGFDDYLPKSEAALARLGAAVLAAVEGALARSQLAATEGRYRELFESLPLPLYLSFADGVLLGANPALVQLLGYPDRETLVGTNVNRLYYDPAVRERWKAQVLAEGTVRGFEVMLRRHDGTPVWVRETSRAVWGEDGATVLFQGCLEDISERRAAESALREGEARYRALLESARRRDAILEAVTFAAARFLEEEEWHDAVGEVLARLGGAAGASRAYLVQRGDGGGVLERLGARFEWVAPGLEFGDSKLEETCDRWVELLEPGHVVAGPVRSLQPAQAELVDEAVVSVALVPILADGQQWGFIGFDDCFAEREWSAGELEALRAAADIVGSAVHLARTRAALENRTEELEILNRVNGLLAGVLDAKTVMQEIADTVRTRCAVDHVSFALLDEVGERLHFVAWSGTETGVRRTGLDRSGPGIIALVAREGRRVWVSDVSTASEYLCFDERVRCEYAVPLVSSGRTLGVLNCEAFAVAGIGRWERELVDRLAAQAAIALRNADVYRRLEASEAQYREFVEHLPVGVLLLEDEGRVLLANPVARDALGVLGGGAEGEVLERLGSVPLARLLDRRAEEAPVDLLSDGPRPRAFEARARRVGGGTDGQWVVVLGEVTAERETKRQLQIQERLAAVGQLAAGIAHDFNNMLQTVLLHCDLARRGLPESDPTMRRLRAIDLQCAHGTALIRQILDFARKTVTQPHPMDLGPFVKEAVKLLASTIPERVLIRVEVALGETRVVADPGQLQQLLTNLATNANDAMPEGGELRVVLSTVEVVPGGVPPAPGLTVGRWVELEVADTGCGMSPHVLERVFEPFFTTKQPGQGTGLGLAQVYGIVQQHGGAITATSEPGRGSVFRVFLPLAEGEATLAPGEAPPPAPRLGDGEVVLVAEDDAAILELARDGLEALGYRVLAAANGYEALEMAERHRDEVALLLSDVVMPGIGGVEVARRLREQGQAPRVVLMTGYPLDCEPGDRAALGVVACLSKPFSMATLARTVHDALRCKEG